MRYTLLIESGTEGLLYVNGQFCGPMERGGQAFPAGENTEMYIQLFPFGEGAPLTAALEMREGRIVRLEPENCAFALVWPDGVIQLELHMAAQTDGEPAQPAAVSGALMRYLTLRLASDPQADRLWLRKQDEHAAPDLSAYQAVVPLRFAPLHAREGFDDRAGLVRRVLPNAAVIDAAMAVTSPAGQGCRLLERIEIFLT